MGQRLGWRRRVLAVSVMAAAGCGGTPPDDATEAMAKYSVAKLDEHHFLGEPIAVENLTVWPVLTNKPLEIGDFLTLRDAQALNVGAVRELGVETDRPRLGPEFSRPPDLLRRIRELERAREPDARNARAAQAARRPSVALESTPTDAQQRAAIDEMTRELLAGYRRASVGTLEIENTGDLPILVCAGTVLKGGNQDRQIAQDFVVPPHSRIPVDAFCVERGRWSDLRQGARTAGMFLAARGMAPTNVRAGGQYERNQGKVWQEVARVVESSAPTKYGTSLALSIDDAGPGARDAERRLAQEVRAHFDAARANGPAPVGFAYAIDGKPVTVRTFAHSRIFDDHFDSFVVAMCMEAHVAQRRANRAHRSFAKASAEDVVALVSTLDGYREELRSTGAANHNGYRRGNVGFHSSCYVEQDNEQIALTRDWTAR